jgi:hypothetical protein
MTTSWEPFSDSQFSFGVLRIEGILLHPYPGWVCAASRGSGVRRRDWGGPGAWEAEESR